jgi:hypothetical protein
MISNPRQAAAHFFGVIALLGAPGAAIAADAPPVCTGPAVLPPELAAWATPHRDMAARDAGSVASAELMTGRAASVTLWQTEDVAYPLHPEKLAGPGTFGGLLHLVVATRGTYRVALATAAWIDLIAPGGTAVPSVTHSRGPACSGIRKMVDFMLEPGTYTLQVSGNAAAQTEVLVLAG